MPRSGSSSSSDSPAAVAKRLYVTDHAFTSLEGKVTGAMPQKHDPENPIPPPPLPLPDYQPLGGKLADLCRNPKHRLYLTGGALLAVFDRIRGSGR